ncbi:MAG: sodium-dependent bicarbonate transport family permease [Ketobacter sp.]|nr:sodium-dependent bicarbonate transport family permease [Ketobacter sp.]
MTLDIVVAFFVLGAVGRLLKADLVFPAGLHQSLTVFLMLAIGLKGGEALAQHGSAELLLQGVGVVLMGVVLTLLAFPLLRWFGEFSRLDAASIAAHYGSVSVGTYAVAVAFLETRGIEYEAYFPLFVALLEVPAIVVGILLAKGSAESFRWRPVLAEISRSQGLFLMVGGLLVGALAADQVGAIGPLFKDLFKGVLALFLLDMGVLAASRFADLKTHGAFVVAFGVAVPLLGAALGGVLGGVMQLSAGGVVMLAVLGASSSYIAVPAAMRSALPDANHGLAITASLGVTFPFNVMIGIPLYCVFILWFMS